MRSATRALLPVVTIALAFAPPASADLVFLVNGRSLSVASHRVDGDRIVLSLRSGGELACHTGLVDHIEPDEVAWPDPPAPGLASLQADPAGVSADAGARPFADLIEPLSAAHGVDARLVRAVVAAESNYAPLARSRKGAMGLMQLMPSTARQYAVTNPYDPRANLDAGIRHLKSLLDRFDVPLALAAYNAGEAAVRRHGGVPPYRETRSYVSRILAHWQAPVLGLP